MKIIVIGGIPESLTTFRGPLIRQILSLGHEVIAMAGNENDTVTAELQTYGASFETYPLQRNGTGVLADLATCRYLTQRLKVLKPDLVFAYTVKPVVWGGLACRMARVPAFHALITGLGAQFDASTAKNRVLSAVMGKLYKTALRRANTVIFQNNDDRDAMVARGSVPAGRAYKVNGSGVDLSFYPQHPLPDGPPVFLTIARLLAAKGLRELAGAARIIKKTHPEVIFRLACMEETGPGTIPLSEVGEWEAEGIIENLGQVPNAVQSLSECHVCILPSYYGEGVPRTILEAMAIGRPVLSTDNVGCRDAVEDGISGILVEPRSVEALVTAINWYLDNRDQWAVQAGAGRQRAERLYDVHKVNNTLLEIMQLTGSKE